MDFLSLESLQFSPHLFDRDIYSGCGCGFNALATLTGIHPLAIRRQYKKKKIKHFHPDHCDLNFALDYLAKWFIVEEVKQSDLTHESVIKNNLTERHILLMIQSWISTEETYTISYGKIVIHNYHVYDLQPFEFLNRPPSKIFIVKKKNKP